MYAGMRKYGAAATFDFPVYNPDGVDLDINWVPVQADCELMKDGGASTAITATAVDEGVTYSIALSATEMQCARGVIKVQDAATKVILDLVLTFETYGHASAQHAFDLDTAADWNVGKTGYSLTTADWNVGKTGYSLTATTGLGNQTANITGTLSGSVGSVSGDTKQTADVAALITTVGAAGAGLTNLGASGNNWNTVTPDAAGVAPTAAEIETEVWDGLQSAHVVPGSMGILATEIAALQTDLDTVTAGVTVTTNNDKTGYALTTADWNVGKTGYSLTVAPLTAAEVNAEVDTALADINLDHFVGTATAIPALPAGTYLDLLQDDGTAVYSRTTDSLQAIRDHATTIKTETALIVADTGELQTDDIPTSIAALSTKQDSDQVIISDAILVIDDLLDLEMAAQTSNLVIIASDTVVIESQTTVMNSGLVTGACEGTPTTTVIQTNLAEITDDHYIGRIIVFTSGNALGEASNITDYAGATGTVTVALMTTAPANTDTFTIY